MTDKVTLKTTKGIIKIIREKSVGRMHDSSSILGCPHVHFFLPSEKPSPWTLPHRVWTNIHMLMQKLGHMAPNISFYTDQSMFIRNNTCCKFIFSFPRSQLVKEHLSTNSDHQPLLLPMLLLL